MTNICIAIAFVSNCISQNQAQQEYEAYHSKFRTVRSITGAISNNGGPVSQPSVSTFRALADGRYAIFRPNSEEHCDGKTCFDYSPIDNTYSIGAGGNWMLSAMFGGNFGLLGTDIPVALSVSNMTYDHNEARSFRLKTNKGDPFDLIVRKRDSRPLALVQGGNQSSYEAKVIELHLDKDLSKSWINWTPPKGAKLAEFLPGL